MTHVYLSYYKYKKNPHCFTDGVKYFSNNIANYINSYETKVGQNQRILARVLLYRILKNIYGKHKAKILISKISKNVSGKDIISENSTIDFSYSYSQGIVICALTLNGKIGIDIEKITDLTINDYNQILCTEELLQLQNSSNPSLDFLQIWTKKEAILKMQGTGFLVDDSKIKNIILENTSYISNFTKEDYVYAISTNSIDNPTFEWI